MPLPPAPLPEPSAPLLEPSVVLQAPSAVAASMEAIAIAPKPRRGSAAREAAGSESDWPRAAREA